METEAGDNCFAQRHERETKFGGKSQKRLYQMLQDVGTELHNATQVFSFDKKRVEILDLCIAPGGFGACALRENLMGVVDGFGLPVEEGGHPILVPYGKRDSRIRVHFSHITMWAEELGVDTIPKDHPDASKFCRGWPYVHTSYDLVICDGQVLSTHQIAEYRERTESTRLPNAQLVLGLRRIKPGGTLILLFHRIHKWRCLRLLRPFNSFAKVQVYKPKTSHTEKSSFYLVAKNV